ncbi:SDR family oxidoreductase, partial [Streptomyces sp. ISL-14]|nr:SDR family oxidoreductase [Streptomyces sp. ISL-14]
SGSVLYCLVRADGDAAADRRLRERLTGPDFPHLAAAYPAGRLIAVAADFSRPRLGLAPARWAALTEQIAEVHHCGAEVHLTAGYRRLAPPNVGGTRQLLTLAEETARHGGRPVPFHFVSTLAVFLDAHSAGHPDVDETTPISMATAGPLGYTRTKAAAEREVIQAHDRGVTATIMRPGLVTGHSDTGRTSSSDLLVPLLRASMALGAIPDRTQAIPAQAVDLVARDIAALSAVSWPHAQAFHLVRPVPLPLTEALAALGRAGNRLDILPRDDWWQRVNARFAHRDIAPLISQGLLAPRMLGLGSSALPTFHSDHTWSVLHTAGVTHPELDDAYFDRLVEGLPLAYGSAVGQEAR